MIFWLISIYPFHLLFNGKNPFTLIELVNNFFHFTNRIATNDSLWESCFILLEVFSGLFFTMATMFSDWPLAGVLLICGFYRWKNTKWGLRLPNIYTTFFLTSMLILIYVSSPQSMSFSQVFSGLGLLLVIPLLFAYSGERGYSPSWV